MSPAASVPMKLPSTTLSVPAAWMKTFVLLSPIVFAEAAVVPPTILFELRITTPEVLPRMSPSESVPMKSPITALPSLSMTTPAPLKPMVLAEPAAASPIVVPEPAPIRTPCALPGPAALPVVSVPRKFPTMTSLLDATSMPAPPKPAMSSPLIALSSEPVARVSPLGVPPTALPLISTTGLSAGA